ncbi:MAG: serine/threonine protein kinase [Vulcanimicrobiota bacterium]
MSELSPETLLAGRYKIKRFLGRGGSGTVYLAEDLTLGAMWAVKHFSLSHLSPEEKKAGETQCSREINLLTSLSHPQLPKVADFFHEDSDNAYVVMEYIQGETLADLTARTRETPGEETVREWALQICEALEYLHCHKPPIIFRDLKPHNLILTPEGIIRFIDFGIARLFNPVRDRDTLFMGTPGYAPPEQFGKGQTDQRSDIYSLGATLHYLLTGRDPGENPFHFDPVTRFNPQVSPLMEAVVARAVEIEPHHRFTSVKEMKEVLSGKKKLDDLLPPQWIIVEPSEVHFERVQRGKVLKCIITLTSPLGKKVRGRLKAGAPWLDTEREAFYGDKVEVQIEIDTGKMDDRESAASHIEIITDAMKIRVPVHVTFLIDLFRRLPDWKAGALLLLIPLLSGALWYGVTHFRDVPHFQNSIAVGILFAIILIAFTLIYRGKERNFTGIVCTLMAAYFCTEGRFLDFFLLLVYALWSARTVIKLYNGFSTEQQKELVLFYYLALALPALAAALAFYLEPCTMSYSFIGETLVAVLITASITLYCIDRWRPAFTRKISTSIWTDLQAGIARYKNRFFSNSLTAVHLFTAAACSLIWGGLALLNNLILEGNMLFLHELRASWFPFEYWTLGLPYALSRVVAGDRQSGLQVIITFATAFLLSLFGTFLLAGGERLLRRVMKNNTIPYLFRIFIVFLAVNITVLILLLLNVRDERAIYYTQLKDIRESQWVGVAGSDLMRKEVRLYGQNRLAAYYFSQDNYEKALSYYRSMEKMQRNMAVEDEGLRFQISFMTGLACFYLGELRQAAMNLDEIVRTLESRTSEAKKAQSPFQSRLMEETGQESIYLDREEREIHTLKTEEECEASLYYYHGLCKGYLTDYRDMALSLARASELYNSPPLISHMEYMIRRLEIAERQNISERLALKGLKRGQVFYNQADCSKALQYHHAMAQWLLEHDLKYLSAMEKEAEHELQNRKGE